MKRQEKLEKSRDLLVTMRPEFAQALQSCQNFSCKCSSSSSLGLESKGRSAILLKESSKRKRKKSEIEEVKHEEVMLKENR